MNPAIGTIFQLTYHCTLPHFVTCGKVLIFKKIITETLNMSFWKYLWRNKAVLQSLLYRYPSRLKKPNFLTTFFNIFLSPLINHILVLCEEEKCGTINERMFSYNLIHNRAIKYLNNCNVNDHLWLLSAKTRFFSQFLVRWQWLCNCWKQVLIRADHAIFFCCLGTTPRNRVLRTRKNRKIFKVSVPKWSSHNEYIDIMQ